jgi:outer membrane protein assembly factor BamB
VTGKGFGSNEDVAVEFDGTQVVLGRTDRNGSFQAPFRVPSAALPGDHIVLAIGIDSGLSAKATFEVRTDWVRFHLDAGNGGKNVSENVVGVDNVMLLRKRWSYQTGGLIRSSPVVVDHIVYVGSDDGSVYALSATTGAYRWDARTGGPVRSVPDVVGGIVYVGSEDHSVYAFDAMTGRKRWSHATVGSVDSSPNVVGGIVYVGSDDGRLYALDAQDGSELWSYQTGGMVRSAPAVQDGKVYVSSFDGNVYALDAATGEHLMTYRTTGPIEGSPVLTTFAGINLMLVGSDDHVVYAIDADTGKLEWSYLSAGDVYATPAISLSEGITLIGTHNWNMESHDLLDGHLKWLYGCPHGFAVYSSPAVANGVVYYGCRNGSVYALDTSVRHLGGAQRPLRLPVWSFQTGGPIYSSAAVSDGLIYIGSDDGTIYAFGLPPGTDH